MMSCHVNDHYGCHKCHEGKNLFMEDLIMSFVSKNKMERLRTSESKVT